MAAERARVIDENLFLAGAREKHHVNLVAVRSVQVEVLPVEGLH